MTGRTLRCVALAIGQLAMCTLSGGLCIEAGCTNEKQGPDGGADAPPFALFALQPTPARVGTTITLEGTFGDAVVVNFPGGISIPASTIGPHRASVGVPTLTTIGGLTVSTGTGATAGVLTRPLPFRRTVFPLGLGNAQVNLEQPDAARPMPSLAIVRRDHACLVIGNYVYAIGGSAATGALDSIERAAISADGSLGAFVVQLDVALVTGRHGHTLAVVGNRLYVIGGHGQTSVERSAIADDGALGKFETVAGVALTAARGGHAGAVIGNSLYVVGGRSGADALATVERATIATDGSLGPFSVVPAALTVGRSGASATVVASQLYIIGGRTSDTDLKTIERAAISSDGSLGSFSLIDVALSTARHRHTATVLGNVLYVQGGTTTPGASIERSTLSADGSPGPFTAVPGSAASTPRSGHANAIVGNYLYSLGGDVAGTALSSVERSTINAGGAIAAFDTRGGGVLQVASESHCTAVIGNHLYVFGGLGDAGFLPRIERADIATDGSLGPFTTLGTVLSRGRYLHACAVAGNHIYLIGGRVLGAPTSKIDHSVVASDGTLGFVEPASVELETSRQSPTAVTIDNHLYVIGGLGSTTVERASIAADGSLGRFFVVPGVSLSAPRWAHTSAVLGKYLYNVGGTSGSSTLATVERAAINPDGSLGAFAVVPGVTLGNARAYHASVVIGSYLYVLGGGGDTSRLDSVERAPIAADGSLGSFTPVPGAKLVTGRMGLTAVALAGQVYVLGGQGPTGRLTSVEQAVLDGGGAP